MAPKSEDFKKQLNLWFEKAVSEGKKFLDVKSGDLHRAVGGYPGSNHNMPGCCSVMYQNMKEGDEVLAAPPGRLGASVLIRYNNIMTRLTNTYEIKKHKEINSLSNNDEKKEQKIVNDDKNTMSFSQSESMKELNNIQGKHVIIIQCSAGKQFGGEWIENGKKVKFVANPLVAGNPPAGYVYKKPQDISTNGKKYIDELVEYNKNNSNPMKLFRAADLYKNETYKQLDLYCDSKGWSFYILSAGWGLIKADYLIPNYDITFTSAAVAYKKKTFHRDTIGINMMDAKQEQSIFCFVGKSYYEILDATTGVAGGKKYLFYLDKNGNKIMNKRGYVTVPFTYHDGYRWNYACAQDFMKKNP